MFSIKLANGKEASFEHAADLAKWYQNEKMIARTSKKEKEKEKDNKDKNV